VAACASEFVTTTSAGPIGLVEVVAVIVVPLTTATLVAADAAMVTAARCGSRYQ